MCILRELKLMRERWNLSQDDLAKIIKTDRAHLSRMENKEVNPSVEMVERWADALGCNLKLEFRK